MPAGEESLRQGRRVDHEAEHGEVLDAAGIGPEQAQKYLVLRVPRHPRQPRRSAANPRGARPGRARRDPCRHRERIRPNDRGTTRRRAGADVRSPGEEALDVRVGFETFGELTGHQLHAAGAQVGMIDAGERVEDRSVQRAAKTGGDIVGGLFRQLTHDHLRLRLQRRGGAILQIEDQRCRRQSWKRWRARADEGAGSDGRAAWQSS